MPRAVAAPGRKLKDAAKVAESAGRILLVERVRTTTHRVLAVGFDKPVLGNTWWALRTELSPEFRKIAALPDTEDQPPAGRKRRKGAEV